MFKLSRKLYNWVLHWADTSYATTVLVIVAFSEASFFPIPPDVILIALILAIREKAFKYALICSISSIMGGIVGYLSGYYLWWNGDGYSLLASFFSIIYQAFLKNYFSVFKINSTVMDL